MPAYEVSRTLVKSPPEVWAELEQAERLAELLGDEAIKITRRDPETAIEWQGTNITGKIEIAASGWGTKVTLRAEAEEAVEQASEETHAESPAADTGADDGGTADEPADAAPSEIALETSDGDPGSSGRPDASIAPADATVTPGPTKPSFWKRVSAVFTGARPAAENASADEPSATAASADERSAASESLQGTDEAGSLADAAAATPVEPETQSLTADERPCEPDADAAGASPDNSVDVTSGTNDFEARLSAVLDHLGAAHKRPFSAT